MAIQALIFGPGTKPERQLPIYAPVLRGDPTNIAELALAQWGRLNGPEAKLNPDVLKQLCAMRWPGNVRELNSFLAALHSFHKSDELSVEQIRELQRYFATAPQGYVINAEDPSYHRIECVRHLRRADEVLHACELQLKPLADCQPVGNQERSLLSQTRMELQILLGNRLFFHSQETYDAVARLDSDLDQLLELRDNDSRSQIRFWNDTVYPHLHSAIGCIFGEVQRLMAEE